MRRNSLISEIFLSNFILDHPTLKVMTVHCDTTKKGKTWRRGHLTITSRGDPFPDICLPTWGASPSPSLLLLEDDRTT